MPEQFLIAARNGVALLPVGITGSEKVRGKTWFLRRPKITVNIGRPFHLPPADGNRLTKAELADRAHYIMTRIAELLPREYQGFMRNES